MKFLLLFFLALPAFAESIQSIRTTNETVILNSRDGNSQSLSGRYRPVITPVTGVTSGTVSGDLVRWIRIGNIVQVTGSVRVTFDNTTTSPSFDVSLPIAMTSAASGNIDGRITGNLVCRVADYKRGQVVSISGSELARFEPTNDTVNFTGSPDCQFNFSYSISE